MSNLWNLQQLQGRPDTVLAGETMPAMFWHAAEQRADAVWLRQKELGVWRSWTWRESADWVRNVGNGLLSLGVQAHDRCAILANTSREWVLSDLAILCCGAVSNGIYPTDAASQVQYLCQDSDSVVLFVENDEQLDKALAVRDQLPRLRHIVVFDMTGLQQLHDPMVMGWETLVERGRAWGQNQ